MDRLLRLGGPMSGLGQSAPPTDAPVVDTAEQVTQIPKSLKVFIILTST